MNQQEKRLLNKNAALKKEVATKNRELQIEASLERVRKVAMGMQKSEQLAEAAKVFFEQFNLLGEMPDRMSIGIFNEKSRKVELWVTDQSGNQVNNEYFFSINEPTSISKIYKAWKKKKDTFIVDLTGKNLKDWVKFVKEEAKLPIDEKKIKGRRVQQAAFFSRGFLLFTTHKPVGDEIMKLLVRFARVFNLTYTRFLDLQKAEEQVREVQIQLALERVRARTMAMQKSDELQEIVTVVFNRLTDLDIRIDSASVIVLSGTKDVMQFWVAVPGERYSTYFMIPAFSNTTVAKDFTKAKESGTNFTKSYTGKEKNEQWNYLFEHSDLKHIPEDQKKMLLQAEAYTVSVFFTKNTALQLLRYNKEIFSENENEIFQRFANVFEQAYIRFLDLQKAEAQAREAQIEAALERVRSRTMAMHNSSELLPAAELLFDQLKQLGAELQGVAFAICDKNSIIVQKWTSIGVFSHPYTIEPGEQRMYEAWKNGEGYYEEVYEGERQKKYYEAFMQIPAFKQGLEKFIDSGYPLPTWQKNHAVTFKYGYLLFITTKPFNETQIFIRFGKVFEQTYTRFLDLQKAEAQAREAQIQLALERVRARTMAMQKSDELAETASLLFKQISDLGIQTWTSGFNIWEKDDTSFIGYNPTPSGGITAPYHIPLTEDSFFINILEAKKRGVDFIVFESAAEPLAKTYSYMKTLPGVRDVLNGIEDAGFQLPKFQVNYCTFFVQGFLLFITLEPYPEAHDIFKRFGKVFEQTYTRFLDLQKAEAQAREAQIETALEKVRSRTVGMQKSEELKEVIQLVFEQFVQLKINVEHTGFLIDYKARDDMHIWLADQHMAPSEVTIPYFDSPPNNSIKEAKEKGQDFFTYHLTFEEKNKFYKDLFKVIPDVPEETLEYYFNCPGLAGSGVLLENIGLYIENFSGTLYSNEENAVLMRFGKVFQQTYTRFLDLEKAEAQTREAQIELGLERVRARTMAMQNSDELGELVTILFDELTKLDLILARCIIWIFNNDTLEAKLWMANSEDKRQANSYFIKRIHHPYYDAILTAWKKRKTRWVYDLKGDEKKTIDQVLLNETELSQLPEAVKKGILISRETFVAGSFNNFGLIEASGPAQPTAEQLDILTRFGKVFDLSYTRFNDLKQAEAQTREAQIQLALERARAQSMMMQHSTELDDTLRVFHEQVLQLGIPSAFSFLWLPDEEKDRHVFWAAWAENNLFKSKAINYPLDRNEPASAQCLVDWKSNDPVVSYNVPPDGVKNYFAAWSELIDGVEQLKPEYFSDGLYYVEAFMKYGCFGVMVRNDLKEDERKILVRFAVEFERAYTRFLDLQKAEAQAREANIEAALEKVRSRSLAMHKSEELQEVVHTVLGRLKDLNIEFYTAIILLFEKDSKDIIWWLENKENQQYSRILVPYANIAYLRDLFNAKENGINHFSKSYSSEEKDELYHHLFEHTDLKHVPEKQKKFLLEAESATMSVAVAKYSGIHLTRYSKKAFSEDDNEILGRFANVFEQSYTRFLDLQKAEAQAREAQIEASLERVRSKAMAMQRSEDLADAVAIVFEELDKLSLGTLRCGIGILDKTKCSADIWTATKSEQGTTIQVAGDEPMNIHPLLQGAFDAWLNEDEDYSYVLEGDDLGRFYRALAGTNFKLPELQSIVSEIKGLQQYYYVTTFLSGGLYAFRETPFPEEAKTVMKRFADVFNLTYTRFLDIQRAEAQAREATVEAALEKVRGRAMAMRNSDDLSVTASMVFAELRKLRIKPIRCGVGLLNKTSRKAQLYAATSSANGDNLALVGWVELSGHPVLSAIYDSWVNNKDYYPELTGEELKSYYQLLLAGLPVDAPDSGEEQKQYGHFLPFPVGCLYAWSEIPYNDAEIKILKRFATIIDLTFRRYIELQTSEASAKEAVKQAALDRIRAEIASMRTVSDLERITPLIWTELTILGVPFIRCGVFIMDESNELIHTFLSTPDGAAIAAFHIPYTTPGNIEKVLRHWQHKENYIDHWDEKAFIEFAKALVKQKVLASPEQYLKSIPHGGFYLHFVPFLQGMLYVGNMSELSEEEINLIQSVADAFSTAYARYEDFNKLEAAKQQVEKTLTDLKQAQQQLIQSEKMASLGELTAGIAHEIQNPLNFVNNFSEVNKEMLTELNEEIDKGNYNDAKSIAKDVIANEEKINHHGKRADAIVKGMLQHSRTSAGQKELTDINALADEYLRLSYHGIRAKDKSFNATVKTDFHNTIGKINVVPQDIGRVLLNLYNNAFYVTNEKQKAEGLRKNEEYKPTVSVQTKKTNDKIEIKVSDNGNGIPQNIVDKIFQPFFTTKPTGEGTGLGLSLSYDIIKAHGGEIKVETKEGEGTGFIIQLPA